MLSILVFFLIYAGVSIAVYQLYDIYHSQNFADEEKRARIGGQEVEELAHKAKEYRETGASMGFVKDVKAFFGSDFDPRVALAAFSQGDKLPNVEPLLRRKSNIICNGKISIRHAFGIKTNPPAKDSRGVAIAVIIINCLLALFLGGLSVYSIGYDVPAAWMHDESILMLLIYALILFTHLIAKLDKYMNDLYQIGQLNRHFPAQPLNQQTQDAGLST
ncbi:MAG: hypothetical protein WCD50_15980 [Onishia taeanensis]|uniref:hypothetical protein n=1 Tax=Onishia taeanensis TaxID=284577 RepID=UPI003C7C2353